MVVARCCTLMSPSIRPELGPRNRSWRHLQTEKLPLISSAIATPGTVLKWFYIPAHAFKRRLPTSENPHCDHGRNRPRVSRREHSFQGFRRCTRGVTCVRIRCRKKVHSLRLSSKTSTERCNGSCFRKQLRCTH